MSIRLIFVSVLMSEASVDKRTMKVSKPKDVICFFKLDNLLQLLSNFY